MRRVTLCLSLVAAMTVGIVALICLQQARGGYAPTKTISLSVYPKPSSPIVVCVGTVLELKATLSDGASDVDVTFKVDGQGWENSTVPTAGGIATTDFDTGDPPAAADKIPGTISFQATAPCYRPSNVVEVTVIRIEFVRETEPGSGEYVDVTDVWTLAVFLMCSRRKAVLPMKGVSKHSRRRNGLARTERGFGIRGDALELYPVLHSANV